jgi:hypothetical protein
MLNVLIKSKNDEQYINQIMRLAKYIQKQL